MISLRIRLLQLYLTIVIHDNCHCKTIILCMSLIYHDISQGEIYVTITIMSLWSYFWHLSKEVYMQYIFSYIFLPVGGMFTLSNKWHIYILYWQCGAYILWLSDMGCTVCFTVDLGCMHIHHFPFYKMNVVWFTCVRTSE